MSPKSTQDLGFPYPSYSILSRTDRWNNLTQSDRIARWGEHKGAANGVGTNPRPWRDTSFMLPYHTACSDLHLVLLAHLLAAVGIFDRQEAPVLLHERLACCRMTATRIAAYGGACMGREYCRKLTLALRIIAPQELIEGVLFLFVRRPSIWARIV